MKHFRLSSWALLAVLALAGCKDDDTDAPATSGPDTPAPGLPADCFAIDVETASTEGIKLTYTPEDPEMLYIDMLFDESYLTEDGLTTDDISAQMLKTANLMISKDSEGGGYGFSIDFCLENEMIYRGPHSGTHYGGKPAGSRYYLSVIGLAYDEETNTFAAATQVTLSDVFEITQEALPVDKPWVEMSDPTYADGKITLIITRNEAAGDYLFGGAFAPNYRDTHSDSDIISELAGTEESMKKYLIPEWHNPIVLTGEVAPGEKKLFVATGEKENILRNMQLNWMILQAPYEAGGEVRILDSYAGIQQPEYPAPENPDPADITFEASAQVDGTSVSYTITPSDPDVYYFTYIRPAADVATPEAEQEAAQNLIDTFNNYMRTTYDTVEQYMAAQGNLFKGATTQTEEGFDAGEYCVIYIAAEITITPGTPYDTIEATQIGTLGKTAFTIEKPTSDIPFTTSVQVTGGTATLTITPTDPNAYYVLAFDAASEFATPEGEADMLDWKFTYVVNPLDNQYYDYTGTKQYDIAGYMSSHNDLFQGPTSYTAEAEPGDYCFYFFIIEFDHPNWTVNLSSPLYKVPFTIE